MPATMREIPTRELAAVLRAVRGQVPVAQAATRPKQADRASSVLAFALAISSALAIFPHSDAPHAWLLSPAGFGRTQHEEEFRMRNLQNLAVVSSLAIGSLASAQNAVQWRVQDGGNGHWYLVYGQSSPLNWRAAANLAHASGAHLCTLTSAAEDAWVRSQVVAPSGIPAQQSGPWIGATCEGSKWGAWRWTTGEAWSYTAWAGSEPNNGGGQEFYVQMYQGANLDWNDNQEDGRGVEFSAVFEWSADCNNDGIVDHGQILEGTLLDANGNGVPDACEAQPSGSVRCWGAGLQNTQTFPEFGQSRVPVGVDGVAAIAAGGYHTVALLSTGSVVCWGRNDYGELDSPIGLSGVKAIACGHFSSIALLENGSIACWGSNGYGQCNVPTGLGSVVRIGAGYWHSLAVTADGVLHAWGDNSAGQCSVPSDVGAIADVRAGRFHTVALRTDATLRAWGSNAFGQIDTPAGLPPVSRIAAGNYHTLALTSAGLVRCWGNNEAGQCNTPPSLSGVVQISAGEYHTAALKWDGTVVCWGANTTILNGNLPANQSIVPSDLRGVAELACGGYHNVVVVRDRDHDGLPDLTDNCPDLPNLDQADCDADGVGDACEIAAGAADVNHNNIPDSCELPPCPADITRNGVVDGVDLAIVLATWGTNGVQGSVNSDVNRDGIVNGADLALLLGSWGGCL